MATLLTLNKPENALESARKTLQQNIRNNLVKQSQIVMKQNGKFADILSS